MNGKIELLFTSLICVTLFLLIPITIYLPIDNYSSNDYGISIKNNFTDKSDNRTLNYLSDGAGYVMSKESVKLLVEKGLDYPEYCRQADEAYDDFEVGNYFKNLGVNITKSLDVKTKILFNGNTPHGIIVFFIKYPPKCALNESYCDFNVVLKDCHSFPLDFITWMGVRCMIWNIFLPCKCYWENDDVWWN
uniref:Exported protein n=1 Tax=Strongyloides venezuelensis TaxID=75913 RepID=A0A0K0EZU7_STRVS